MNRDFIVISFSGERFNSLSQTNQEVICAALAKAIISNMNVSIEDITINTITEEELIKQFSMKRVSSNDAVFDINKLNWINFQYMKKLDADQLYDLIVPFLVKSWLCGCHGQ